MPFENVPDPLFFFFSHEHKEAYDRMLYAVRLQKGGAMLTGEYGCGKSTLIRLIVGELHEDSLDIAVVGNPQSTPAEMMADILYELGEESDGMQLLEMDRRFGERLLRNFKANRSTLLIVDEAQMIEGDSVFERLRILLNYQLDDRFLVTLLLVGQPELREKVMALPQLEQRLAVKYHLHTFDIDNTTEYVNHRLKVAGAERRLFTDEAVRIVYRASYGVPRRINNICDMSLLMGMRVEADEVGRDIVEGVL